MNNLAPGTRYPVPILTSPPQFRIFTIGQSPYNLMILKKFLLFIGIAMLFFPVQGQPELKIIGHISSANGLLTDGIKYTFKDSEGFMWFSFEKGFQRWDGYEVKNYSYITDTTINNSYRYCRPILEDKHGNFFIGTLHNGLIKLDRKTDTYTSYGRNPEHPEKGLIKNGVHEMFLDKDGMIWLASHEGLSRFDPIAETFEQFVINHDTMYHPDNITRSVMRDSKGILWVGKESGLYQFNEEDESFIPINTDPEIPFPLCSVECMLEDSEGNMWFGTYWGILKLYREENRWEHILTLNPDKADSDTDAKINCMVEYKNDRVHQVWIGTVAGLKVYDLQKGKLYHITPANGYPGITNAGTVQYLFIDENDILWASMAGITLIDLKGNPFTIKRLLSYPDSLYDERAQCFFEDDEQNIWVGSEKNGVYKFDRDLNLLSNHKACTWTPLESNTDFNNWVWRIYEDPDGRIWMSTGPTCLSIFDMDNDEFHAIDVDVGSYTPGRLIIDPYDVVWLTAHDGLFKGTMKGDYDLKVALYDNPTLPKVPIDGILYDSHHRLWVITRSSGVYCLHPEDRDSMVFKRYLHENYRHTFTIEFSAREMTEDDDGNIWFISHHELFRYDDKLDSIVPDKYFNEYFDGEIYSITRDKNGIIWMGTKIGMLAYSFSDTAFGGIRYIDYRSGMPFTFLTRGPFFRDSRGYIYQGGQMTTERGFFRFHPDSILGPNTTPPPVVLTEFEVRNKSFALDSNIGSKKYIALCYDQNFFSFWFSALDYNGPEKNQYAYMLEGIDDDWLYVGNRRYANYTGIPPGTYTFRVKGSNNDGYWNEQGASIRLTILPPPWKSWWAYTLYALALISLFILWRLYDLKRHRLKQALEIEKVEADKLKELDSLKSRFFANISHEFRTPLTLILGPLEKLIGKTEDPACVNDLNMIERNAKRLQRLINQLLNLSKLEAGEMKLIAGERNIVSLVRGYVHSFESLAKQKNIRLKFNTDEERTLIYVDNDKIEKILYNLLSNAFKFTPAGGEISVSVLNHPVKPIYREGTKGGVNIIVADTGPGIPPDKVKYVFDRFYQADNAYQGDQEGTGIGLALVQELVKLHGGNVHVESEEGRGTTFIVTLPKGYEHLSADQISKDTQAEIDKQQPPPEIKVDVIIPTGNGIIAPEKIETEPGKPIILIVEDNDDLRAYVRSYLDEEYLVYEAVDGAAGLKSAIDIIPDLVISDVMMPRMDGYELCRQIKSDERTSHIPVILLTAKAAREDKLEGLGLGADDFLTKPFDPAELQVRIRNLIDQRQALREKYSQALRIAPAGDKTTALSMDPQFMRKAIKVVEEHMQDAEFSVEAFCDSMAMSRMQLHRKITALTGQTAGEFMRSLRLRRAAELIKDKAGTIAESAYDTGFTTPSYFTECFKNHFGVSPTEFQRTSRTRYPIC